jgi:hypothetical protein
MKLKFKNAKSKAAASLGLLLVGTGAANAALADVETALIAKVNEAEAFGWAILAVALVAGIAIKLAKKFANKAT